ncbi:uncharacterized protein LOC124926703 [Impatiens glandulifera]|uniref:uncharacterized protein LOC124926703 n=1 Tax=Impatiens glandulifera TaxID=253017 RepID=UPI001FB0A1AA|nr:uncharacterized protein LOC124926703 [Impatiens glandulifera]
MGRDWKYYWGGGGAGGRGTGKTIRSNNNHDVDSSAAAPAATSGCCITAVFQLFDFQSSLCHQLPSFQLPQQPSTIIKGAEAPRNSLEIEPPMEAFSSAMKHAQALNIPVGIQIKTGSSSRTEDLLSECSSSSPGLKTPNLVARLMGLDLLPDQTIPLSSSSSSSIKSRNYHLHRDSKPRTNNNFVLDIDLMGSRSLPETPRISSERRSNLDYHRLSLQINRENTVSGQFELSRNSTGRRDVKVLDEENRSPGFYARQIVKKVKDNISRKVGSDITNTVMNKTQSESDHQKQRINDDDDQIVFSKSNKQGTRTDEPASSCSPRLRFLDLKNRGLSSPGRVDNPKPSPQFRIKKEIRRDQVLCINSPNKQSSNTIKNKKEETFFQSKARRKKEKGPVFKKSKKTPLSSELLSNSNVPNVFYVKKNPPASSPLTKFTDQKQKYDDNHSSERRTEAKTSTVLKTVTVAKRSTEGINVTPLYDSVDKTVFNRLEPELMSYESSLSLFDGNASVPNMSLRCNRLLIFDLVNEFLEMEFSRKELGLGNRMLKGPDLVRTVCHKIQNLPASDCRVLEDIDGIIENDLRGIGKKLVMIGEDEKEAIMEKIERELMDKLVEETTSLLYHG